jgi:hypothetical protein
MSLLYDIKQILLQFKIDTNKTIDSLSYKIADYEKITKETIVDMERIIGKNEVVASSSNIDVDGLLVNLDNDLKIFLSEMITRGNDKVIVKANNTIIINDVDFIVKKNVKSTNIKVCFKVDRTKLIDIITIVVGDYVLKNDGYMTIELNKDNLGLIGTLL